MTLPFCALGALRTLAVGMWCSVLGAMPTLVVGMWCSVLGAMPTLVVGMWCSEHGQARLAMAPVLTYRSFSTASGGHGAGG